MILGYKEEENLAEEDGEIAGDQIEEGNVEEEGDEMRHDPGVQRRRNKPERYQAGQHEKRPQLSPQDRKRKQAQAKKVSKNRLPDGTILCFGGRMAFKPPPGMK